MVNNIEVNKVADMVADMEVDMVVDELTNILVGEVTNMEVDMVADMEVHKVAVMEVNEVADNLARRRRVPNLERRRKKGSQFGKRVGQGGWLIGPKLF